MTKIVFTAGQTAMWRSLYTEWQTDGLIDIDAGRRVPARGESREDSAHRHAAEQMVAHGGPWSFEGSWMALVEAVSQVSL
jgi:hypothetical protein